MIDGLSFKCSNPSLIKPAIEHIERLSGAVYVCQVIEVFHSGQKV
ncbi:MAG: hypothetical protein WKF91_13550 [Segetibacter sp.]